MLMASFDQGNKSLNFNIKGPIGTTALCNISIPAYMVSDISNVKIKLDGNLINSTISADGNNYLIQFLYSHSEHKISVGLNEIGDEANPEENNQINSFPLFSMLISIFLGITLILFEKKRKS
jgi:hypothetical protein